MLYTLIVHVGINLFSLKMMVEWMDEWRNIFTYVNLDDLVHPPTQGKEQPRVGDQYVTGGTHTPITSTGNFGNSS